MAELVLGGVIPLLFLNDFEAAAFARISRIERALRAASDGRESELLNADIDGHQLSGSALLDPIPRMRVPYDLT